MRLEKLPRFSKGSQFIRKGFEVHYGLVLEGATKHLVMFTRPHPVEDVAPFSLPDVAYVQDVFAERTAQILLMLCLPKDAQLKLPLSEAEQIRVIELARAAEPAT